MVYHWQSHSCLYVLYHIYSIARPACSAHITTCIATTAKGKPNARDIKHKQNHGIALQIREHFMAGTGLGTFVWFFSMAASLFSGYSVTGIVNEAFNNGWTASRWIPGGVGVYIGFMVMAPRCHALGKSRGYMTVSELIFDRYLPPAGRTWVRPLCTSTGLCTHERHDHNPGAPVRWHVEHLPRFPDVACLMT